MSTEYENRDRILGEIHQQTKMIADWCKKHEEDDDRRFSEVNKKLLYGAVALVIVAFWSGVLGQVLGHIKLGV